MNQPLYLHGEGYHFEEVNTDKQLTTEEIELRIKLIDDYINKLLTFTQNKDNIS